MTILFALTLLLIPALGYAFVRVMSRAEERFRGHTAGWMIMSMLNGIGLGVLALGWIWTYIELLDRLAIPRPWLLAPFVLLFVGAVVYVLVLGRRLGKASSAKTDAAESEPTTPDRRTLAEEPARPAPLHRAERTPYHRGHPSARGRAIGHRTGGRRPGKTAGDGNVDEAAGVAA